jgi:hypothetical protein
MDLQIEGLDTVRQELRELAAKVGAAIVPALRAEAEAIMTVAKERTPVQTGALRASGRVEVEDASVAMSFGGPAIGYAVFVHENLQAHHPVGQAKFLESAVTEALPTLAQDIAKRIEQEP